MNIIGLGTDIIMVERIREILIRHPEHFPLRHFTPAEQAYCNKHRNAAQNYAGRFAAKEAVAKALGTGFGEFLSFLDIEIQNDAAGKPYVELSEGARAHFGDVKLMLSISHCKEYATATAIATT